jgi:hypothetical protein
MEGITLPFFFAVHFFDIERKTTNRKFANQAYILTSSKQNTPFTVPNNNIIRLTCQPTTGVKTI